MSASSWEHFDSITTFIIFVLRTIACLSTRYKDLFFLILHSVFWKQSSAKKQQSLPRSCHHLSVSEQRLPISSTADADFCNALARAVLVVFRSKPSGFESDQGSGPSGWARTSLMWRFLLRETIDFNYFLYLFMWSLKMSSDSVFSFCCGIWFLVTLLPNANFWTSEMLPLQSGDLVEDHWLCLVTQWFLWKDWWCQTDLDWEGYPNIFHKLYKGIHISPVLLYSGLL